MYLIQFSPFHVLDITAWVLLLSLTLFISFPLTMSITNAISTTVIDNAVRPCRINLSNCNKTKGRFGLLFRSKSWSYPPDTMKAYSEQPTRPVHPVSAWSPERNTHSFLALAVSFFSCVCPMASMARSVNCHGQKNAVQVHLIGAEPIVQVKRWNER